MTFCVSGAATKVFISAIALISSSLLAFPQKGVAQEPPQTIYWAGVAFVGSPAEVKQRSPFLSAIVEEQGISTLNQRAWSELEKIERKDIRFTRDLGSTESNNAIAMALALDFEQLNPYYIPALNSVCVAQAQVYAQILTFDMAQKKLLSAFPIVSKGVRDCEQDTDVLSKTKGREWISDAFLGEGESLINEFPSAMKDLPLNRGWLANIQVGDIKLGSHAKDALVARGISERFYKRWLAAQVTSNMSAKAAIPVLPYSLGQAIGGAMPLRFSETSAFNINLPPADYVLDLTARGYVKKTTGETANTIDNTYIFGVGLSFKHPMLDEVYFEENLQFFEGRRENKADDIPPWESFERLTVTSVRQIFSQFSDPDQKWAKKYVNNLKKKKASWKSIRKSFQRVEEEIFSQIRGDQK